MAASIRRKSRLAAVSGDGALPIVAIVGRPNVGKSTFFNRMIGSRRALTQNRPGVTRDRHYGEAEYLGHRFILIDTGGFEPDAPSADVYRQVRDQALLAVDEADVVLLFFDGRAGVVPQDREVIELLRGSGKPTLFVVNKVDTQALLADAYEFYQLGIDCLFPISSEHARGVDDLLDELIRILPERPISAESGSAEDLEVFDEEQGADSSSERGGEGGDEATDAPTREAPAEDSPIRIALVGRPNVGKSSLCNRILGQERQVVHPEAGTTRDSIDIPFEVKGTSYVLIDTAGVRRKARISDKLEQFTVIKAFKALTSCDVALLLIDATEGVTAQEQRLAGMIEEKGRAVAILVNKWDLMEQKGVQKKAFAEKILSDLDHIRYAPVHFLSALTGSGVQGILPLVARVAEESAREIPTGALNETIREAVDAHAPPMFKNHAVRILYATQVKTRPPTFMIFSNSPEGVRQDYRRYLENRLRDRYGFIGAPVHLVFRARKR